MRLQARDVVAVEQDASRGRRQNAADQIDDRRLAGAVRPDERMTRALRELERHVSGCGDATEALLQRMCREDGFAHRSTLVSRRPTRNSRRNGAVRRSRPVTISTTNTAPIQNCQYCGVHAENVSCISLNATVPTMPP